MENLSPFDYIPGIVLTEEYCHIKSISKEQLEKYFKERIYQRTEYVLLESLYRLPYLTRKNMERFADYRLKDKKYAGYENIMRQLIKDGCLRRFAYGEVHFYRLHDGARAYYKDKLDPRGIHEIQISPAYDIPAVLESASLAQWHISVMIGDGIKKSYFGEDICLRKNKICIPSYLEVEKGSIRYKVLSFCVPKIDLHMESFLESILKVKEALYKWELSLKRDIFIIVLVCANTSEMKQLAVLFENMKATQNLPMYYVSEPNTIFSKGLTLLYSVATEDGKQVLRTISIKK